MLRPISTKVIAVKLADYVIETDSLVFPFLLAIKELPPEEVDANKTVDKDER